MAQAIMDPEEVRRFAKELKRFNDDVQTRAAALSRALVPWRQLAGSGAREVCGRIRRDDESAQEIRGDGGETHSPYLLRKQRMQREYLNQR